MLCFIPLKKSRLFFISFIFIINFFISQGQLEGDSCVREYDNSPGSCKHFRQCPQAREDHRKGIPPTICAYLSGQPIICCPKSSELSKPNWHQTSSDNNQQAFNGRKRVSQQKCEEYGKLTFEVSFINPLVLTANSKPHEVKHSKCTLTTPLIIGGTKAQAGEFPHMAALGWTDSNGDISFNCGGSLISERFVLTAAHCNLRGVPPTLVRLSDQNLYTKNDKIEEIDVPVAEFIAHENYDPRKMHNDIALLRLQYDVAFTQTLRPACLWQDGDRLNKSRQVIAAGWGKTEEGIASDELMKVSLNIIPNNQCQTLFTNLGPAFSRVQIIEKQICSGDVQGGKDTCNGDSGGPIMYTKEDNLCLFYVVGLTSFGNKQCGKAENAGVYTRISKYLDWIESKVWQ